MAKTGKRLDFHPHVHLLMPAAAIGAQGDATRKLWRTKRGAAQSARHSTKVGKPYLFSHKALAKGLRRARNFGFLHPNCKRLVASGREAAR